MKKLDELSLFILDLTSFDKKPLHLICSLLFEKMKVKPEEVIELILNLVSKGYLECYKHSGLSGAPYEKVFSLDRFVLINYLKTNKTKTINRYPIGQEFFFRVTDLAVT